MLCDPNLTIDRYNILIKTARVIDANSMEFEVVGFGTDEKPPRTYVVAWDSDRQKIIEIDTTQIRTYIDSQGVEYD